MRKIRCFTRFPVGYLWADPPTATVTTDTAVPAPETKTDVPAGGAPTATTATANKFTYDEDRSNWIKPDKHRAAETAVIRTARELETARAELAAERRRVAALAGVQTQSPEDAEAAKIADAFFALPQFAHLKDIT